MKRASKRAERASVTPPNVGSIIHDLRRAHGLSLDQVAAESGVSKSMLSKIERNQTNPTLATCWRLATAFDVGIEEIVGRNRNEPEIKRLGAHETPTLRSADGRCSMRILGPVDLAGNVEWYELTARPRSALVSEPHEAGAIEHLTVLSGHLAVESGAQKTEVGPGETVRYRADVRHVVRNPHAQPGRAVIVVTHRRRHSVR